jgi:hypothetical protein
MKKYAQIVIIAALSMFMFAVMASGKDKDDRGGGIHGTYEMIATGSCIHSPTDFNVITDSFGNPQQYVPIDSEGVWGATTSAVGIWKFYSHGTGHADIWNYPIDFPPGSDLLGGPRARSQNLVYDIMYQVIKDVIIIDLYFPDPDDPFVIKAGHLEGSVSLDKKTITIPTLLQKINFPEGSPLYTAVCNTMRILIQVGNVK